MDLVTENKLIGQRLKSLRRAAGISQRELGEKLGITFQQIQKYEKGENRISAASLHFIADALGIPISECFSEGRTISLDESLLGIVLLLQHSDPEVIELVTRMLNILGLRVEAYLPPPPPPPPPPPAPIARAPLAPYQWKRYT